MRPLKDIFVEEYWDVLYRQVPSPEKGAFAGNMTPFRFLWSDKRYWYADTFLFENKGNLYLFVECFDNVTETGSIAFSEYINGEFTKPEIILSEKTHLSYPFVFENEGQIYMMPETQQENCLQLYRADDFPRKWVKEKVLVNNINCVDTVLYDGWLISGEICEAADMSVNLMLYSFKDGLPHKMNPVIKNSFESRGAGSVFELSGKKVRPTQNCVGSVYGKALNFYEITTLNECAYEEKILFSLIPEKIPVAGKRKLLGVHTYAFLSGLEVVDVKMKRLNLRRVFWIIGKKYLKSS